MAFNIINLYGRPHEVRKMLITIPKIMENTYNLSYYKTKNISINELNAINFIRNDYDIYKNNHILLNSCTFLCIKSLRETNKVLNYSYNNNIIKHKPINVLVHDSKIDSFILDVFYKKYNFKYSIFNDCM